MAVATTLSWVLRLTITSTGGTGNDELYGGDGSDGFRWDDGDGSDVVEGGEGSDELLVNGAAAATLATEDFTLTATSPNAIEVGSRLALLRTQGSIAMDIVGVEDLSFNAGGGADSFVINDVAQSGVHTINIGLFGNDGADAVTVNGQALHDDILVTNFAILGVASVKVAGLSYDVNIIAPDTTDIDTLTINGNEGDDIVKAAAGVEGRIAVTLNGNAGDDFLSADAILNGGPGNDLLEGGLGADQLNGGAGDDTMIGGTGIDNFSGGDGFDTILLQGTPGDDISACARRPPTNWIRH